MLVVMTKTSREDRESNMHESPHQEAVEHVTHGEVVMTKTSWEESESHM